MHLQWLLLILFLSRVQTPLATNTTTPKSPNTISKPGCLQKCGKLTVPYPFGIGPNCSMNSNGAWFSIICNTSYNPPKAFPTIPLGSHEDIEILDINENQLILKNTNSQIASRCYDSKGNITSDHSANFDIAASPFAYSTSNKLTVIGCDDYALVTLSWGTTSKGEKQGYSVGCLALCSDPNELSTGSCSGLGCCQTSIPSGLQSFVITLSSLKNHTGPPEVASFQPCGYAFLSGDNRFRFGGRSDFVGKNVVNRTRNGVPIVLDWVAGRFNSTTGSSTCKEAKEDESTYACQGNTRCVDFYRGGYHCKCISGYKGNPYLEPGCTDIDECAADNLNECSMVCINTQGSYNCSCPDGYAGDGRKSGTGCIKNTNQTLKSLTLGLSISMGSILLLLACWWMYSFLKRRNQIKQKAKNFERNGGFMLEQQISSDDGVVERIKIFTIEELDNASDHFNENRILGKGGQGTVYKGMLGEGRIVAIKKLKTVDQSQLGEFINEVIILSKINHRNIVRLLGCCMESEVPLLVYEFIPNGTLFHHIHYPSEEDFTITWKMRIQIATDSASALAYLHSSSSIPVFHRDIKSSNILLDEKYRAKLSDFGASKSVDIDQTHVTTRVMGTFGYLDPEYFQSSQFTEKSDVYSFGVVLVELLTGEKAIRSTTQQDKSLVSWFLSHMENSSLFDIVDSQVLKEASKEELFAIANLAMRCLNLEGKKRPTMREVLAEIEVVRSLDLSGNNQQNWPEAVHDWTKSTQSSYDGFSSSSSNLAELPLLYKTR